jgi:hypothetical protein
MVKDENSSGKQKATRIATHTPKILVPTGTYATATCLDTPTCPPYLFGVGALAATPAVLYVRLGKVEGRDGGLAARR